MTIAKDITMIMVGDEEPNSEDIKQWCLSHNETNTIKRQDYFIVFLPTLLADIMISELGLKGA